MMLLFGLLCAAAMLLLSIYSCASVAISHRKKLKERGWLGMACLVVLNTAGLVAVVQSLWS